MFMLYINEDEGVEDVVVEDVVVEEDDEENLQKCQIVKYEKIITLRNDTIFCQYLMKKMNDF